MPAPMNTARRSLLAGAATLLSLAVTAPAALAAPAAGRTPAATPPAHMSTLGGARLGRPGNQVNLAPGVPVLPKDLTARSWIVSDAQTGEVLAAHDAHWALPPASTMKMLFADTLLPRFPRTTEHKVAAKDLAGMGEGSSVVGVRAGRTYSVRDLWLGVFLRSGNDAVHVLSAMNGGVAQTVRDMQQHADELQALDTHVVSPDGYDEPHQVSSAYDLTLIARSGLQKKDFRDYCSTVSADFGGERIRNTNRLLSGDTDVPVYQGIAGVKNGNTTHAGATFTGVAQRGSRVLLVTVMNPQKREHNEVYKETAKLFDWGFQAAGKVEPVGELVPPRSAASASAAPGGPPTASAPAGQAGSRPTPAAATGSRGIGTALALVGGLLVLLAGGVFLVNRRWPLPDLMHRRPRP
ncbi:D-alanyl-D-alanine carboxypeptidase family protein [Streptomyces malaysiense]|uniref:D-alanyl-D-alanine carboxypeptidase n=1 Tax=Streptomyces malaysiense TaxID=1428626 RepID=A0A1J4Q535_9ACTN|nr:D-alanyl-D-alanine carboxypeptidase [Streptomyces malaysiense]OIK28130.1 D-alanyl-D-alanine carboxypeptidase [Streptomyces malaysiense]